MLAWRKTPVRQIDPHRFVPPHCGRESCPSHLGQRPFRYKRHGWYDRTQDQRRVRRFFCYACRRTFSQQTFDPTYYKKRAHLLEPIAAAFAACSGARQLARTVGCAPSTATHWAAHLGRHDLLLLNRTARAAPDEPIVYDHLETFAYGQDHPCGVGIAVGHRTWLIHALDFAPHRRSGRMTAEQKARQASLPRSRGDPYRRALVEALRTLLSRPGRVRLHLITDGKPSYVEAVARTFRGRVAHEIHPNPRRTPETRAVARARDRAMFPSDQLHALLRHSSAALKRETIAFSKRHNALLERVAHLAVWRNLVKARSERVPDAPTAAMAAGLTDERWEWARVYAARLFPWQEDLPPGYQRIYRREIVTPPVGINRRHTLRLGF